MSPAEKTEALDALAHRVDLNLTVGMHLEPNELELISEVLEVALETACAEEWKAREKA